MVEPLRHANETTAAPAAGHVFVIDDDPSVRESLELLIKSAGFSVETFASAPAFLARPPVDAPACLVLDVNLPTMSGLDLQRQLGKDQEAIPIIFITGRGDIPMSVRAMKAGAAEFLTKPFHEHELLGAIASALVRSRAARGGAAEADVLRDRYGSLTLREQQVMALVVDGLLNKQIAAELGIAEPTIKTHRGRVMRKMKAASLADLVRMAGKLELRQQQRGT
jgi:FixJ family two-component response regulator